MSSIPSERRRENNPFSSKAEPSFSPKAVALAACGTAAVGLAALAAGRYRVAGSTEYIVRTGLGIKDISIRKKAMQWPFQTYKKLSMTPKTFTVVVPAMSGHRIPFKMPSVWTVGPKNDPTALTNYARLLIDKGPDGLEETVDGIIKGETRILSSKMNLDSLFQDREGFKKTIVDKINDILDDLGLIVYNANIEELADLDDKNAYFSEQKKRALQDVNQKARVDVSEATRTGEIGEKENLVKARIAVAGMEREARLAENERAREVAESDKNLAVAKATFTREQMIAEAEAKAASEERTWELQQKVEEQRKGQEVSRRRATEWAEANVGAEVTVRRAEGDAQAMKLRAEAALYAKQKEADGIRAVREAEADGLKKLMDAAGGGEDLAKYLLVSQGQLPVLAGKQAEALQNLKPQISVWNTGPQMTPVSSVLTELFTTGMPLFDGIRKQTGFDFLKSAGVKKDEDVK